MGSSDKNPELIRQRMDELRNSLKHDVADVATSVRTKSDWKYYVRNYPWLSAGAATAVGYLLIPQRIERAERVVPQAEALEEIAEQEKLVLAPESEATPPKEKGIAASLMAFALAAGSRAAMGYFSNKLGSVLDGTASRNGDSRQEPAAAVAEKRPK